MKILITGSKGQLGSEIRELAGEYPHCEFIFTDVEELDITNAGAVEGFMSLQQPQAVVNCAAYTAVDKAESDPETAFLVNSQAPANLAEACNKINALLIHISTDYVFDGKSWLPYSESSPILPVSVYAKSKWEGETRISSIANRALIIRTSWLYSAFGNNFVKTILRYGKERGKLNVVYDQTGTPTYARDLAKTLLDILPGLDAWRGVEVFNYSNEGVSSWYDFAIAIIENSGIVCHIHPIETKDYPLPAVRPFYSVLNKEKIKSRFKLEIPYWRDSLIHCLARLNSQ